jgi:proline iminopeptidase
VIARSGTSPRFKIISGSAGWTCWRIRGVNAEAASIYASPGAFDPDATRAALGALDSPVLLLAGEVDLNTPPPVATEFAALFRHATLVVQPGTAHYPWLDNGPAFLSTMAAFLGEGR